QLRRKLQDPSTDLKEARQLYESFCKSYPNETDDAVDLMWQTLLNLRARDPGQAIEVGKYLTQLPSPLDRLSGISHPYLSDVVAVLGQPDEPKLDQFAISPDCKTVAGSRADGTIDIWEVATGKKSYSLGKHKQAVLAMAFSPNNSKLLVTSSFDKTIRIWN